MQLQQLDVPQVIDAFTTKADNKRILKTFLLNGDLNKLKFRIRPDYIPKHIARFEGRPAVLTSDHYHPRYEDVDFSRPVSEVITQLLKSQEKYAIGIIRKIDTRIKNGGIESDAYIELTDPKAIEAFDNGDIPKYVSPTIFKINKQDPDDAITDFEGLHLAFVDIPSYGFNIAKVKSSCNGDLVACYDQLKNNGINCIKAELASFKNKFTHSSFSENFVKNGSLIQLNEASQQIPDTSSSNTGNSLQQTNQQQQSIPPIQQQQQQNEGRGPLNQVQTNPKPEVADELQLRALDKFSKEQQEDYKSKYFELEKRVKEFEEYKRTQEIAARKNIIEGYITAEAIPEDSKRQEKIKFYLESAEPNDRLVEILKEVYLNKPLLTVHTGNSKSVKHGGILSQYADTSIGTLGSSNNGIKLDPKLLLSFGGGGSAY